MVSSLLKLAISDFSIHSLRTFYAHLEIIRSKRHLLHLIYWPFLFTNNLKSSLNEIEFSYTPSIERKLMNYIAHIQFPNRLIELSTKTSLILLKIKKAKGAIIFSFDVSLLHAQIPSIM